MDGPRVEAHCLSQDEEELMNRAINRRVITRNVSRNENDERWWANMWDRPLQMVGSVGVVFLPISFNTTVLSLAEVDYWPSRRWMVRESRHTVCLTRAGIKSVHGLTLFVDEGRRISLKRHVSEHVEFPIIGKWGQVRLHAWLRKCVKRYVAESLLWIFRVWSLICLFALLYLNK